MVYKVQSQKEGSREIFFDDMIPFTYERFYSEYNKDKWK